MTDETKRAELLEWLYVRAGAAFERAGEAFDRRDMDAHTEAFEEHKMIAAAIAEINTSRISVQ